MDSEITTADAQTIIEILNESPPQTSDEEQEKPPTPNYKRSPSRGKNIDQLKAIHDEAEGTKTKEKPGKPTPPPRKRKRPSPPDSSGPGRPTKDTALVRDAKIADSDSDDTLAIREVALFSANGQIRKRTRLLTKHDKDIKCFAIKHFLPLEYIAEQKTIAFGKIKKQRQKLKTLNYMEQNVLANLEELQNF
ncbi:Hypothetical predicted protein [Paramuricea clavata]|uniref:Uncharacterized protein n=1 Tax=Paramuricea clavata TaxID=317549 RepID=A0A7D9LAW6_PARCT|nr:Hypothetical predicted protein [Paramuricea clavata]